MNEEQKRNFIKKNIKEIESIKYRGVEIDYDNLINDYKELNFFLNLSSKHIYYKKDFVEYQEVLARAIIIVDNLNNMVFAMSKINEKVN